MKELSVKEKAKRYDEVREKIAIRFGSNVADEIFSQFEMSEDEKIRKALIEACKQSLIVGGFHKDKVIAWLEKQGEHNHWKPSKEQIEALEHSLGDYNIKIFEDRYEILKSLYSDLKKLKEE